MDRGQRTRWSKRLSYYLRHAPDELGLTLDAGGWVAIDVLLSALSARGEILTPEQLAELVATSDKQRFAIDNAGVRVRANQGHSVEVDLELAPMKPPDVLFHGTTEHALVAILREGLSKMARHHVHLSTDVPTARRVGSRRGRAIVLAVDAGAMHAAGATFFRAANGVWLVDHVPASFLRVLDSGSSGERDDPA